MLLDATTVKAERFSLSRGTGFALPGICRIYYLPVENKIRLYLVAESPLYPGAYTVVASGLSDTEGNSADFTSEAFISSEFGCGLYEFALQSVNYYERGVPALVQKANRCYTVQAEVSNYEVRKKSAVLVFYVYEGKEEKYVIRKNLVLESGERINLSYNIATNPGEKIGVRLEKGE